VATAAVRDAEDGPEFREEVLRNTGLEIQIVGGDEEARLSAQGVLLGWPGRRGWCATSAARPWNWRSFWAGARWGCGADLRSGAAEVDGAEGRQEGDARPYQGPRGGVAEAFPDRPNRLFLVGGSWRAIARIDMERRGYPLKVLHEYRMTPKAILDSIAMIGQSDIDALRVQDRHQCGADAPCAAGRRGAEGAGAGAEAREVAVSSYGIREGLLVRTDVGDPAPPRPADRGRAPCRGILGPDAGVRPRALPFRRAAVPARQVRETRLIRAACLLHDVSWRAHPDYRAEVCFDNATRANLGGLTHGERVYLGLALLHRYKSNRDNTNFNAELLTLLPEAQVMEAEILGRAMRFGAMFTVARPTDHGALTWRPKRKELILTLKTDEGRALFGEVTEARFRALAGAMGAEAKVVGRG
jgi:exopolyphosphatase/guanosine-5'-triphosphate,3'-diphosphate pyrophosphatase